MESRPLPVLGKYPATTLTRSPVTILAKETPALKAPEMSSVLHFGNQEDIQTGHDPLFAFDEESEQGCDSAAGLRQQIAILTRC